MFIIFSPIDFEMKEFEKLIFIHLFVAIENKCEEFRELNAPEKTRFKYSCKFRQTVEFTIDFNYFFFTVNDSLRQIFFAREYLTNANNSNEHLKICGIQ